jgi:hypothetical protein
MAGVWRDRGCHEGSGKLARRFLLHKGGAWSPLPPGAAGTTDERSDFRAGTQRRVVATFDRVDAFLGGVAESFDFGFVFLLALLQQTQAFPHYFAGVAELARLDAGSDQAIEMFGQMDVSCRHGQGLFPQA